jgi:hypothetical protein
MGTGPSPSSDGCLPLEGRESFRANAIGAGNPRYGAGASPALHRDERRGAVEETCVIG